MEKTVSLSTIEVAAIRACIELTQEEMDTATVGQDIFGMILDNILAKLGE